MTARSGDALSHANFQARADVVFDDDQLSRIRLRRTHRNIALRSSPDWFRPNLHGGHERSGGNEPVRFISFEHYLNKSSP
jgi:hypothetical protein